MHGLQPLGSANSFCKSLGLVIKSHGFSYHCYADDTQLFLSFPPFATQVNEKISACLADICSWMARYHLKVNLDKTELLYIPHRTSTLPELYCSQQDGPSLLTGHHSGLHTSSTTPLCCHSPSRPSCQPCNSLSLVPTAELLHPRSPVVERSPHPHKNCSLSAHFPPQLENSPLHSVPRLLFGSFLIYCPFPISVLSPCIFLFSTYKLYLSWYGSLTWLIQLVYLIHIHDLSTKSM